jgi:WD40 repeat protein/tRNA A-37 threonylcarbamoyl transferase component Bud32
LGSPDAETLAPEEVAEVFAAECDTASGAESAETRLPDLPQVPGYEILGKLGHGGMGVVYKARHLKLNRVVALKMILAGEHASPESLERFRIEAEAVARLQHPNIVQIYEIGEQNGLPYFSLEYLEGGSLAQQLDGTPLAPRDAAELVATMADAVQAAHAEDIVHRDLKPANVLLTKDRSPKITDFGLAKRLDSAAHQTQSGAILGTPSYMAPEQAEGGSKTKVGPATDIYALGAILYELLTGRPPFRAATPLDTVLQLLQEEPVRPRMLQSKIPRDLEIICLKCLEKEPARRFQSARALSNDLERFLAGEPIRARTTRVWERAWKWCRRRPEVAIVLVAIVVGGFVTVYQMMGARSALEKSMGMFKITQSRPLSPTLVAGNDRTLTADKHPIKLVLSLSAQQVRCRCLAYSPNGRHLASGGADATVKIWDTQTGKLAHTLRGHEDEVYCVAYSADGLRLASAGGDRVVRVWDTPTGREVMALRGHTRRITSVVFGRDGKLLISGSADHTARVWDGKSPEAVHTLDGHADAVNSLAISHDGHCLATAGEDGQLVLWNLQSSEKESAIDSSWEAVRSVAFSPDGQRLAVVGLTLANRGLQGVAQIWKGRSNSEILFPRTLEQPVGTAVFSPDGRRFVVIAGLDAIVCDADSGVEIKTLRSAKPYAPTAAFSPDSRRLALADGEGNIKLWILAE